MKTWCGIVCSKGLIPVIDPVIGVATCNVLSLRKLSCRERPRRGLCCAVTDPYILRNDEAGGTWMTVHSSVRGVSAINQCINMDLPRVLV